MVSPHPITVSQLFDKLMVCLDCQSALSCWQTWVRPSFCTSFGTKALVDFGSAHRVTFGECFRFLNFSVWHIRCLCYIRQNSFFVLYWAFSEWKYIKILQHDQTIFDSIKVIFMANLFSYRTVTSTSHSTNHLLWWGLWSNSTKSLVKYIRFSDFCHQVT